jgi:predicted aspartyl protease
MTISRAIRVAAAATVLLPVLALAQDQEKKIKRSDLPAAVEKAVVEQSQRATIRGFSQEKENGHTFYEAELTVNGHSKDVLMDMGGAVVEMEEQVPTESLPPAVRCPRSQGRERQACQG